MPDDDRDDEGPELDPRVFLVPDFLPGARCQTEPGGRQARVRYVGKMPGMPQGYWVGVQYDEKVGKNDGTNNGRRYFRCPQGHGGFVRATKITKLGGGSGLAPEVEDASRAAGAPPLNRPLSADSPTGDSRPGDEAPLTPTSAGQGASSSLHPRLTAPAPPAYLPHAPGCPTSRHLAPLSPQEPQRVPERLASTGPRSTHAHTHTHAFSHRRG